MISALAVLGVLALITSGRLQMIASSLILGGLVVALLLPDRLRQSSAIKFLGALFPVGFLLLQLARLLIGQEPIPIIVEFAAGLQIVRLATRRGAQHDHQVILLALLQLIVGTVLGSGLAYAFSLAGFLVFTPGALVLSHLRREVEGNYQQGAKDRSGSPVDVPRILRSRRVISARFLLVTCVISLPIFLLTSVLFVLFPRVGFAGMKVPPVEASRVVGFSDHVNLGGVGKIRSNPQLVMRVQPLKMQGEPPLRMNFYLRGSSFDHYEKGVWQKTISERRSLSSVAEYGILSHLPGKKAEADYRIELEGIQPRILFLPAKTSAFKFLMGEGLANEKRPRAYLGSNGEIIYFQDSTDVLRYDVFLDSEGENAKSAPLDEDLAPYLDLPDNFSVRMQALALEWAEDGSELKSAQRVQQHLRSEYTYDLESSAGAASDPLADFLFNSKRGHCEFYSTSMVLLLRSLGIPARNVTGFGGGSYNRFGDFYGVRQGDAHSWVEAYLEGQGWTRFDPTPPGSVESFSMSSGLLTSVREFMEAAGRSWEQNVVGFDLKRQVQIVQALSKAAAEAKKSTRSAFLSSSARWWYLLAPGFTICLTGIWFFFFRKSQASQAKEAKLTMSMQRSRMLYSEVESAMVRLGYRRPAGTPPLKHARALVLQEVQSSEEFLLLTERYLQARFGSQDLSQEELQRLKERVRQCLKQES